MSRLRRLLLAALLSQTAVFFYVVGHHFGEILRYSSTVRGPWTLALAGDLALIAALAVSSKLWAEPGAGNFAASALAHIAALVLFHYLIAISSGRLYKPLTAVFLAFSMSTGALRRFRRPAGSLSSRAAMPPFGAWDAASVLVLATLIVPLVFPYIYMDTQYIWACRALALEQMPVLSAMAHCTQAGALSVGPTYPPGWSILLWLGIGDPIFQGRLLAWSLLPIFALFFRERLSRLEPSLAPAALFFFLVTGQVWSGAATWYADVPLMIFLSAGSLLVLGMPQSPDGGPASRGEVAAGGLCLCAAVLLRPDGWYYMAVPAAAAAWFRIRRRTKFPLWPFAAAALVFATWVLLRPAALDVVSQYFHPNAAWLGAGSTPASALEKVFLIFLYGWQGQWLFHWRTGILFWLLAGILIWRRRGTVQGEDTRFFGLISAGFL
ncbi:MAG: hypothetical protein KGL04_08695, partial [Elusimicrobia bacterium]|nr:hypothetical protein [Elusimicrobiota bacterium]